MTQAFVSVAVFAYNEEETISACLDAIRACAGEARLQVHVLVNGATDRTEAILRGYAAPEIDLRICVIERGDKANAWNHYVHEIAPEAAVLHVFTDGDMRIAPGSIEGFLAAFATHADANGCAGLPLDGRSREAFRNRLVQRGEMAGNLYALRGACVMAFRQRGVRLPFGIFGEDGLVSTLVKWNLDMTGARDDRRIIACAKGGFHYASLSPFRLRDWRTYHNRRMRYAVRRQQADMLYDVLFEQGVAAMPAHVIDLYRAQQHRMSWRWNGLDTWFDWVARRRIRRDIAAGDSVRLAERAHLYS